MKRAWYLPDKHPETRRDRSNGNWGALLIIIWRNDGVIWPDDDMTHWSRWSLSFFGIRRDIVSVLSSNHFSSQQLTNYPTNRLLSYPNMPMMNSRTFQSSSGLNTITRPSPRRSGGDYPSGQQVYRNKSGLLLMKTDLFRLRSMTWSSQTFHWPRSVEQVVYSILPHRYSNLT